MISLSMKSSLRGMLVFLLTYTYVNSVLDVAQNGSDFVYLLAFYTILLLLPLIAKRVLEFLTVTVSFLTLVIGVGALLFGWLLFSELLLNGFVITLISTDIFGFTGIKFVESEFSKYVTIAMLSVATSILFATYSALEE